MTNFAYTNNIPFENNSPSVDQPPMKINTNSISGLIAVDHIGFDFNNGGAHQQVQLLETAGGAIPNPLPSGLIGAGFETLYASNLGVGADNGGQLFFVHGADAGGIQLTGPYNPSAGYNGYTFLAGGMLMQWGFVHGTHGGNGTFNAGDSSTVTFPIAFPNTVFSIQTSLNYNTADGKPGYPPGTSYASVVLDYNVANTNNTTFGWEYTGNTNSYYTVFYWMAIGN